MLIDTSAWAEYFKKTPANGDQKKINLSIKRTIREHILNGNLVYTCPIIVQEVLQGALKKEYIKIKSALQATILLSFEDQFEMAEGAAQIYQTCRDKGVTVRKSNDCLIAYYALQHNIPLLFKDRDFNHIAKVYPLKVVKI